MDLKFLGILLLLAVAAYADPSAEIEEIEDPVENDEALDDVMDDDDEDLSDDLAFDEEDLRGRLRRKAKKVPYFSKGKYCVCSKQKQSKEDETEDIAEKDVQDHIDDVAEDVENAINKPRKRLRPSKKHWKLALRKLVYPFFKAETLGCFCTRNRAVVRLLNYLHLVHYIHLKQKKVFIQHVKYLVAQVKKQRGG
ncbi:uncharacterized protein LOC135692853 isoform X1 [Rhopilema esculentum]|uniref:uncharacterized protein LOC135692853 isoform X1 n=1 Tax=Rhopilema esculentum TaxID=499914 RepID=UPI0031DA1B08